MPARVTIFAGPARSGKSRRLAELYREALASRSLGSCLWIAPNHWAARDVRRRLVASPRAAWLAPGVTTFAELAFRVVEAAAEPARPLDPLSKRRLLAALVDEARRSGELEYFAPIADSRGFVDLLAEWITDFKRVEIWPDEFDQACRRRGQTAKDRELLMIYARYQQRLNEQRLYDSEGRIWAARELIRRGHVRPFDRARFVVVDGFADFTRTEHEVLEGLAVRLDSLYITLPLDNETARADLFDKSRQTLAALESRHADAKTEWFARPAETEWPALVHLEAELFKDPRRIADAPDSAGLEIIAAGNRLNELEIVARKIKRLLVEGDPECGAGPVPAEDVAVVYRSLAEWAPLVREVFGQMGIPLALETAPALIEFPPIAAWLNLIRLDQEDWPFRRLLSVLSSNYFRPLALDGLPRGERAAAERVVRRLQVPSGRQKLIEAIAHAQARAASRLDADAAQPKRTSLEEAQRWRDDLAAAERLNSALAAGFDRLPTSATMHEWHAAVVRLAEETGWVAAIQDDETVVWNELGQTLDRLARAGPQVHARERLTRVEFYQLLGDIARWHHPPSGGSEAGRVAVLSAVSARPLSAPYLFLAGLTERSFPAAVREDRLYSELDEARLRDSGLPLVLRAERHRDEMLLFYELATSARRRLYLSYPALDERGEPLLPSPYLAEVERAFAGAPIPRSVETGLSPAPTDGEPTNPRDFRVCAVEQALDGESGPLAALVTNPSTAAAGANILAALQLTRERGRRDLFGAYEGMLPGAAALDRLSKMFDDEHLWSPSQFEQYAHCPFRFFAENVLGIEPPEDLNLEIDHARRGWLLHETLATVHRQISEEGAARDLAAATIAALEQLTGVRHTIESLEGALLEIDRRVISLWCERYAGQHAAYGAQWSDFEEPPAPAHFEVSFGLPEVSDDPLSTPQPLVIADEEVTARIGGRIDRIDLARRRERLVFNIIDYKTGYVPPAKKLREFHSTALQLDLYALAAEDLLLASQEAIPWTAGYWQIRKRGFHQPLELAVDELRAPARAPEWADRRERLIRTILALVRAVRRGQFPMASDDDDCTSRCPFRTVCRVHQVRAMEKRWSPTEPTR